MTDSNDKTLKELIEFLDKQPGSRPKVIAEALGVTRQYVQKLLIKNKSIFSVSGSGPNRFYSNSKSEHDSNTDAHIGSIVENSKEFQMIEDNFYALTPLGEELIGFSGFVKWCTARNFDLDSKQEEYIGILKKYYGDNFKPPIDFSNKLKSTFKDNSLKNVWAVDYYNFEVFGKTKLGTQVMIAKQTGDSDTLKTLIEKLSGVTSEIIDKYKIEAIAFVSPTIQRQSQLMSKLENAIEPELPRIKVHKVGARILIAQKTLKNLEDRILNAAQTFIVESPREYKNILIIDDELGSGATLNELAKQIQKKNVASNCYGLVLVASPSGYEVINEV